MRTGTKQEVYDALVTVGYDVIKGKGGFWIRGEGFVSLAQARKRTGVIAPKRQKRIRQAPYGDLAWIAAINRIGN